MSVDRWIFVGPYMRVWGPKKKALETIRTCPNKKCPNHKKSMGDTYCGSCSSTIMNVDIPVEYDFDIHSFTEEHFKNCDMFMTAENNTGKSSKYTVVVPNNRTRQGGIYIKEDAENEISMPTYGLEIFKEKEDWAKLISKLTELNIKFEMKIGIVQWYS